jgi:20S proteasome subunit beta 7
MSSLSLSSGGGTSSASISASASASAHINRTRQPIVTGTSILAIQYSSGVMLAADTLCSYGSMAKYKDARRLIDVNKHTLIGGGGEYSDFQSICDLLKRNALEDLCTSDSLYDEDDGEDDGDNGDGGDNNKGDAKQVWNYLRAVMYNRRNKMNPLWNDLVVAGFTNDNDNDNNNNNGCFLGLVDKIGTTYTDNYIATGFGSYLALPILREKWTPDLSEGEARAMLEDCMRVLFYRDCRALNRIQIAKVTKEDGVLISDPYELETEWSSASFVEPKGQLDGDGGW